MTFFERLQVIMMDMKWDQKSLSRQCGITEKTITRWKKNPEKVPSIGKLHEICEQSEYDLDWLMYGVGEKKKRENNKVSRFSNRLLDELEGWLLECQEELGGDQFSWFKGVTQRAHPDFVEYLKKRDSDNTQDRSTEDISVNSKE